jgi:hypothetical protein
VKKSAKRLSGQMNLSLLNSPTTIVPASKQGELTLALVELLISAAQEDANQDPQGGKDEFQAHA